jgi:integrase/recombinase XerD
MKSQTIQFPISEAHQRNTRNLVKDLTIAECKIDFMYERKHVRRLSSSTIDSYEKEIDKFIRFLKHGSLTSIFDVSRDVMLRYVAYLNEKPKWSDHPFNSKVETNQIGLNPTSVNNTIRILKCFFNHLVNYDVLDKSPMKGMEEIKVKKSYRILEKEDVLRLYRQLDTSAFNQMRDLCLIVVLVDTGLRIGECLLLDVKDVKLSQGFIHIRSEIAKDGEERFVPLNGSTQQYLKDWIRSIQNNPSSDKGERWLWVTSEGTHLTYSTFSKMLKKYAGRAGLDKSLVHPHAFRHYCATQHIRRGATPLEVQKLLGHVDQKMMNEVYLHLSREDFRRMNTCYSPANDFRQPAGRKTGQRKLQLAPNIHVDVESLPA